MMSGLALATPPANPRARASARSDDEAESPTREEPTEYVSLRPRLSPFTQLLTINPILQARAS